MQLEKAAIARLVADQVHSTDGGEAADGARDYSNLQVPRQHVMYGFDGCLCDMIVLDADKSVVMYTCR